MLELKRLIYEPRVAFRGTRTYVHSTTIYERLIHGSRDLGLHISGPLDMRIKKLIRKQPQFVFIKGSVIDDHECSAVVLFRVGETPWNCLVSERAELVNEREEYDERQIREGSLVEGSSIRVAAAIDAKPFEVVTCLTLQLHNGLFSIPPDRKWFLARIQLDRLLLASDVQNLRITLAKKSGVRLTRCTISCGAVSIGTLDFMLGNAERPLHCD